MLTNTQGALLDLAALIKTRAGQSVLTVLSPILRAAATQTLVRLCRLVLDTMQGEADIDSK